MAEPFRYCFALIINKMIDERKRFKLPTQTEAYLDFEFINEEKFRAGRQNGAYQDIDFIESDFTTYLLKYYFKAKGYQKSYPIYLGGELKQKLINGINSGIKYYTIHDLNIDDIMPEMYEKFKELSKSELKKLIVFGFRRMHTAMKYGCAITIVTSKHMKCHAYIGDLSLNQAKQIKEYI